MNNESEKNENTSSDQSIGGSSSAGTPQTPQNDPNGLYALLINAFTTLQNTKIAELSKSFDEKKKELDKKIDDLEEKVDNFRDKTNKNLTRLSKEKLRIVELIGVFVVIFTFISVEVQILKYSDNFFTLAGLSLIFIAGIILVMLLLFIITERWIMNDEDSKTPKGWWVLLVVALVFFLLGILLGGYGTLITKNDQDLTTSLQNQILVQNQKNKDMSNQINNLENRVNTLELGVGSQLNFQSTSSSSAKRGQ